MRLLAVPNWSFGPDSSAFDACLETLDELDVDIHFAEGDPDHNRTVTAFSGAYSSVSSALRTLAEMIFPHVDMAAHRGVHPRIGALDVCPLIPLTSGAEALFEAKAVAEYVASALSTDHALPVYLYEKSERGRHEADLPTLRKGQYEGLFDRMARPDFGPPIPNPSLGATIMGVRDFLIALNVDLSAADPTTARAVARTLRDLRQEGDSRFPGVRALGFPLASRRISQVSLNLTLPDLTPIDPIVEWIARETAERAVDVVGTELIGVIREKDLAAATHLDVSEAQILP